jgi:hypothetical protein
MWIRNSPENLDSSTHNHHSYRRLCSSISGFRGFAIAGPSCTGKLAKLSNAVIAFEAEVDGEDLSVKGWEWK